MMMCSLGFVGRSGDWWWMEDEWMETDLRITRTQWTQIMAYWSQFLRDLKMYPQRKNSKQCEESKWLERLIYKRGKQLIQNCGNHGMLNIPDIWKTSSSGPCTLQITKEKPRKVSYTKIYPAASWHVWTWIWTIQLLIIVAFILLF